MANAFTVIYFYAEYATEDFPSDTLIRTVEGRNAFEASRVAQRIASQEGNVRIRQPSDLQALAVFPGHVCPALRARDFRRYRLHGLLDRVRGK